ncbi:Rrf2 family transcriptional regulator [Clostridium estertheticum]|uniref:Rrf2 family transcriptional regulator n=1 Tax=Clostridium estertheticum TaxID=238834 RepID=A0AA47EGE2_9CLOT|nr:Rrf2 family transcriptional regulator [Clostridium estertheticum]MBU3157535.1 Rrf2 family transcriptional regulator [Clostridium estertheticum]MBU3179198.1 Rrf2 family transcriptional regulator [Clostridium estertheticum]WAG59728.1 Rrf2 family transcriptional regulator [Clostridium estertheticum]
MQISSKFTIGVHLLVVIDYLGDSEKVTSNILAGSIGVNPVIVRNVMGNLKEAGIINISQGKSGISLARGLNEISFYDIYKAVDCVDDEGIFHFHENPNPECPIGRNIHKSMDGKLAKIQECMENEMRYITVADVAVDVKKEIEAAE